MIKQDCSFWIKVVLVVVIFTLILSFPIVLVTFYKVKNYDVVIVNSTNNEDGRVNFTLKYDNGDLGSIMVDKTMERKSLLNINKTIGEIVPIFVIEPFGIISIDGDSPLIRLGCILPIIIMYGLFGRITIYSENIRLHLFNI